MPEYQAATMSSATVPVLSPGSAASRAEPGSATHRDEAVEQLAGHGRVEIGDGGAGQPRRQSTELIDGDGLLSASRQREAGGQGCSAGTTDDEPAAGDQRPHAILPAITIDHAQSSNCEQRHQSGNQRR